MRRRPLRKDFVFRLYLAAFMILATLSLAFVLKSQADSHARVVSALERRIVELEERPVVVASSDPDVSVPSSVDTSSRSSSRDLFFVIGSGYNRKWAYLDVEFNDGTWERFYFKPFPSRAQLAALHRRIEHDALKHFYAFDAQDEDDS